MKVISKFLIFSFSFSIVTSIYPIAVFHGIVDSCEMTNTSMLVNDLKRDLGVHVECIEVGNGYMDSVFMPFTKQAELACESIKSNPNFKGKFSVLGISQGTLIGRYIVTKCQMQGQVMRYMSLDGPQMGIGSIPKLTCGVICDFLNNITASMVYNLMDKFGPSGYYKYRYDQKTYKEKNVFLKMLNNENDEKDMEIYNRFTSLEKAKFIKGKYDTVITPRDSSWFEFYDEEGRDIVPLNQSDFYKNDNIGLRKLIEENKVSFVEFNEEHVLYNIVEYYEQIVDFFLD
jgi:palmitoyl-protein thioesterase